MTEDHADDMRPEVKNGSADEDDDRQRTVQIDKRNIE